MKIKPFNPKDYPIKFDVDKNKYIHHAVVVNSIKEARSVLLTLHEREMYHRYDNPYKTTNNSLDTTNYALINKYLNASLSTGHLTQEEVDLIQEMYVNRRITCPIVTELIMEHFTLFEYEGQILEPGPLMMMFQQGKVYPLSLHEDNEAYDYEYTEYILLQYKDFAWYNIEEDKYE